MKTQNNQLIWQGLAYNARKQVTDYLSGDDNYTKKNWDDYGFQKHISIPVKPFCILAGETGLFAFIDCLTR